MGKAGWIPVILLVIGVLWFGSKLSSAGDPVSSDAAGPVATAPGGDSGHRGGRKAEKSFVARDVALARRAVLHPDDVNMDWREVPPTPTKSSACPGNRPDLSRYVITGEADRSYAGPGGDSSQEARVKIFANELQASGYFEAVNNEAVLRCVRDGIAASFRRSGAKVKVVYARLEDEPALGEQTAIYLLGLSLRGKTGVKQGYPVELLSFRRGRAVVSLGYSFVYSEDGSRPCACELNDARVVGARLAGA
jgi:hypothetical protein